MWCNLKSRKLALTFVTVGLLMGPLAKADVPTRPAPSSAACTALKPDSLELPLRSAHCFRSSFESRSLRRTISYTITVPAHLSPTDRLPYAIFLHGRGGDENQLIDLGSVSAMNEITRKRAQPFLIFAVSGGDHYWMNAAGSPHERWGDMVTQDFVHHIEEKFRVRSGHACGRALFGISMGGHGTAQLGLNNPRTFCTALSISPVFRRAQDIWSPGSGSFEPPGDYIAFGQGADYEKRSPRHICAKNRAANGSCLPFKNYWLDIGADDDLLDKYPDTRKFIGELKSTHPQFPFTIQRCGPDSTHSYAYWSCQMPKYLMWLSRHLKHQ